VKDERAAYAALARVYEAAGWGRFSYDMADTVLALARQHGLLPDGHVVDLACGVGIACVKFAQAGYRVTGVDLSAEMLAQARQKAGQTGVQVNWLERDMRDWQVNGPADLVTSMYDALNYMLTAGDLGAVFACVGRALKPGGLFIFDMNTIRGLAENWGTRVHINFEGEDLFIANRTCWDHETSVNTLVLHGFARRDGGLWEHWCETHVQRGFPKAEIRRLLSDAGLQTLTVLDAHATGSIEAGPQTTRVLMVAVRG
jgi:2-polyprenyl-3-methyl-5-hydroxy-6-metoxy-1,4-benzoquinol methylase